MKPLIALGLLCAVVGVYLLNKSPKSISLDTSGRKKAISKMSAKIEKLRFLELQDFLYKCKGQYELDCRRLTFKRLYSLQPGNYIVKSNYAYTLTESAQHEEAKRLYKSMLDSGEGDYLLMAYYANSLKATGETNESIKWLKSAISLRPSLVGSVKELAIALVEVGKPYEAISVIEAFISQYPESKSYLMGNLVSIKNKAPQLVRNKSNEAIDLIALSGSHHFLPIKLDKNKPSETFMVDSGASLLTMSKDRFEKAFGSLRNQKGKTIFVSLANGKKVKGKAIVLKEIVVGPWILNDVETFVCEECTNLAGKSILRKFETQTRQKGSIEYLNLKRI